MNITTFYIAIGLILTLISLLSPNICYFIHKKHFIWIVKQELGLKRANYLYTINRYGRIETVVDCYSHPLIFLAVEKQLGNDTHLLFIKELSDVEFNYYYNTKI